MSYRGLSKIVLAAGAIVGLAIGSAALATETQTYSYDAKGRLIVKKSIGSVNSNQTHSYCYDKAGNRVTYSSNSNGTPAACVTDGT